MCARLEFLCLCRQNKLLSNSKLVWLRLEEGLMVESEYQQGLERIRKYQRLVELQGWRLRKRAPIFFFWLAQITLMQTTLQLKLLLCQQLRTPADKCSIEWRETRSKMLLLRRQKLCLLQLNGWVSLWIVTEILWYLYQTPSHYKATF